MEYIVQIDIYLRCTSSEGHIVIWHLIRGIWRRLFELQSHNFAKLPQDHLSNMKFWKMAAGLDNQQTSRKFTDFYRNFQFCLHCWLNFSQVVNYESSSFHIKQLLGMQKWYCRLCWLTSHHVYNNVWSYALAHEIECSVFSESTKIIEFANSKTKLMVKVASLVKVLLVWIMDIKNCSRIIGPHFLYLGWILNQ